MKHLAMAFRSLGGSWRALPLVVWILVGCLSGCVKSPQSDASATEKMEDSKPSGCAYEPFAVLNAEEMTQDPLVVALQERGLEWQWAKAVEAECGTELLLPSESGEWVRFNLAFTFDGGGACVEPVGDLFVFPTQPALALSIHVREEDQFEDELIEEWGMLRWDSSLGCVVGLKETQASAPLF